jgi:hypothetical protein
MQGEKYVLASVAVQSISVNLEPEPQRAETFG